MARAVSLQLSPFVIQIAPKPVIVPTSIPEGKDALFHVFVPTEDSKKRTKRGTPVVWKLGNKTLNAEWSKEKQQRLLSYYRGGAVPSWNKWFDCYRFARYLNDGIMPLKGGAMKQTTSEIKESEVNNVSSGSVLYLYRGKDPVHAMTVLADGLFLSKLGSMSLYVGTYSQHKQLYGTDSVHVCTSLTELIV